MTAPKRIQMTRRKGGWRKENPDAVIVARPSKWGNPFAIGDDGIPDAATAAAKFKELVAKETLHEPETMRAFLAPLRNRDLACWCPLDTPCHADVLLEIANDGGT